MWMRAASAAILFLTVLATPALAEERPAFTIGYLEFENDVRYEVWGIHPVDIRSQTNQEDRRPRPGAEMGITDIRPFERRAGISFALAVERVTNAAMMVKAIARIGEQTSAQIFLIDAPGAVVAQVGRATRDQGVVLINVSAADDALRNDSCAPHLLHTAPSRRMLTDAIAQHLVDRRWDSVLILEGPLEEDAATTEAFHESARTYGIEIEEVRAFVLSGDPRMREKNNLDLLTGQVSYDAVFIADVDREFARTVPFATRRPAPVVGAAGLVATAWHWSYLRHGAPQVHGRFERQVGRRMEKTDWGAWVAVRAVAEAIVRTESTDGDTLLAYLLGPEFRLDGSKGPGLTFRPWNGQLRQPLFLASDDWVSAVAPIPGFTHRVDDLDTLGVDERSSACPSEGRLSS